jgi:hypothetical protein
MADIRLQLTGGSSATWCPDGKIVLTTGESGLMRVSASGGDLAELVPLEKDKETDFHDASCLPDSSVLFVPHAAGGRPNSLSIFADGRRKELLKLAPDQDIWFPVYSPAGFILYHRHPANAGVWALPFSLAKREATGDPFLLAADADVPSVSNDGTLVYVRGAASRMTRMHWVDRSGKSIAPIGPAQEQWPFPSLSPDGRYAAIVAKENEVHDVWIHDVERGTRTRLSAANVPYSIEAWSPDAKTILYNEGASAPLTMKTKNVDGSGETHLLRTGYAAAYSTDGRYLLFADYDNANRWDLSYIDLKGDGKAKTLITSPANERWARLSPDGRYFAYVSDESGADEIYLKRFPQGGGRWQVSVGGGMWARWNARGDKIYYARGDAIVEVDVASGPEPRLGAPREVFSRKPLGWQLIFGWAPGFDVSPDEKRFVIVESQGTAADLGGIMIEENWRNALPK